MEAEEARFELLKELFPVGSVVSFDSDPARENGWTYEVEGHELGIDGHSSSVRVRGGQWPITAVKVVPDRLYRIAGQVVDRVGARALGEERTRDPRPSVWDREDGEWAR